MKEINFYEIDVKRVVSYLQQAIRASFTCEEFEWEFNKKKKGTIFKMYQDGEVIIASQAMLPIKLVINGRAINTSKSESSYLNKDYRGANHFENLYFSAIHEAKKEGSQIIWGFTPAVKVWKNKLKFEVVKDNISEARLSLSKYPSNEFLVKYIKSAPKLVLKKLYFSVLRAIEKKVQFNYNLGGITINSTLPKDSVLSSFQAKFASAHNFLAYLEFNNEYIKWRITENPLLHYQWRFFYENGSLIGYVLFSLNEGCLSFADIAAIDPGDIQKMIFSTAIEFRTQINAIYYFGSDDNPYAVSLFQVLKKNGAEVQKSTWANTVIKDISEGLLYESYFDTKAWYINGLWTEGYSV